MLDLGVAAIHASISAPKTEVEAGPAAEVSDTDPSARNSHPAVAAPPRSGFVAAEGERRQAQPSAHTPHHQQRYLGDASDITFWHAMRKELAQSLPDGPVAAAGVDSYEQDDAMPITPGASVPDSHSRATAVTFSSAAEGFPVPVALLPSRLTADKLLDIYFSTIHVAYPFVCEPLFRRKYEEFWKGDSIQGIDTDESGGLWVSLLCKSITFQDLGMAGFGKVR